MDERQNPYAAPTTDLAAMHFPGAAADDAESIRRRYLNHEASVQSIGFLYYLAGVIMTIVAGGWAFAALARDEVPLVAVVVNGGFALVFFAVGEGLRRLRQWTVVPVSIISGLLLLAGIFSLLALNPLVAVFQIGINGYILYLVLCEKGRKVLSFPYKEIMRLTPHIKYKSPLIVRVLLVVVLIVLGLAVSSVFFM